MASRLAIFVLLATACSVALAGAVGVASKPSGDGAFGSLLARKRPIITGCLAECGAGEQSCVTDCQVCVEKNVCGDLANCKICRDEARETKKRFEAQGNNSVLGDSGGAPLVHEGIRQLMMRAQLQSLEGHRRLRSSRTSVLEAQRLAEWAVEERKEELDKLRATRAEVDNNDKNKEMWLSRATLKLNGTREEVTALEKELRQKKKELNRLERRVEKRRVAAIGGDISQASQMASEIVATTRVIRRMKWQIKELEKEVEKKEDVQRKEENDVKWFKKGLVDRGLRMARDMKEQVKSLKAMKANEKVYRQQLRSARQDYRNAVNLTRNFTHEVRRLETELEENPMPSFVPAELQALDDEQRQQQR
mmetsp:Transcript_78398/g.199304  ORF Transcript_78398/g.199304 Transcript_78398/m.199304 type:complete len:364 (-) Transcript_78398:49-1140(-)